MHERKHGSDIMSSPTLHRGMMASWPAWVWSGGVAVFAALLALVCMTGLIGSDDLEYARHARAINDGTYAGLLETGVNRHLGLRFALILPLAAVYELFGVSEFTTILLPLIASTLAVMLLVEVGRRMFGLVAGLIAGLLYATFPLRMVLGTVLAPELFAECYLLLGVLGYLHARDRGGVFWLLAGLLMGSAYLAKEPALFIAGGFLLHALWERRWAGAAAFSAGVGLIGAAELTYYGMIWGDVFFRSRSTQLYTLPATGEYFNTVKEMSLYRIFRKYPHMMLVPHTKFGLHSLATVIGACWALALKPRRGYLLVVLWIVVPALYLNFGSWSLKAYAPLPRDERYIELLYPPLMLLTGVALSRAFGARPALARLSAATLALVMGAGIGSGLALRGEIAYAQHMNVLREIVRGVQAVPGQTVYTENDRWLRAMHVFDASLVSPSAETATFVLTSDALGLPAIEPAPRSPND